MYSFKFYSMLPHTEAKTAPPTIAAKVILGAGALLTVTGLHLSVEQQFNLV